VHHGALPWRVQGDNKTAYDLAEINRRTDVMQVLRTPVCVGQD
jgi:hypothetical protein